jgi:hypothetical protein
MNKDNKSTELNDTDKKLHISGVSDSKSWDDIKTIMSDYIVDKIIKGELGTDEQTQYYQTIDIMSELFNPPTLK